MAAEGQREDTVEDFIGEEGSGRGQRELETREHGIEWPEHSEEEWDLWSRGLWAEFSGAAPLGGLPSAAAAAAESRGDSVTAVRDGTGQDPWMSRDPWQWWWQNSSTTDWWP